MARLGVRNCNHSRASRSGGIDGGGGGEGGVVVKKRTAELLRFCWHGSRVSVSFWGRDRINRGCLLKNNIHRSN